MKFHLSADGVARKCAATKRPCTLEHFENSETAEKFFENSMQDYIVAAPLKTVDKPDLESAEVARWYTHYCIENNLMHNSSMITPDHELASYSSPRGLLELKRRIFQEGRRTGTFTDTLVVVSEPGFIPMNLEGSLSEDKIKESILKGKQNFTTERATHDKDISEDGMKKDSDMQHALVDYSHKWMSRLTTDEQEAVSFATSNGFSLIQTGAGFEDLDKTRYIVDNFVPTDDYFDSARTDEDFEKAQDKADKDQLDYCKNLCKTYNNALKKAPLLDTPIMTYRGTTVEELSDILGLDKDSQLDDIIARIKTGEFAGKIASENSRISKIPESCTTMPGRASRFGDEVALEIKQKTNTSVATVSSWGAKEYEMLTNPNSKYRVDGLRTIRHDKLDEDYYILELEEIVD